MHGRIRTAAPRYVLATVSIETHICSLCVRGSQEEHIERRSGLYRLGLDPALNPLFADMLRTRSVEEG